MALIRDRGRNPSPLGLFRPGLIYAVTVLLLFFGSSSAFALTDPDASMAQGLSDESFALLNSLSGRPGASDEVSGAIASFAGDAQTLATALSKKDARAAGQAMAALVTDRRLVDNAMEKSPGAIPASQWAALKGALAKLEKDVPTNVSGDNVAATGPSTHTGHVEAAVPPPPSEIAAEGSPPKVQIQKRITDQDGVRLKGFLEGTNLKSAGIYDGDSLVKEMDVGNIVGEQRINFDIKLEQTTAQESIRVSDASGRTAQAMISPSNIAGHSDGHEKLIELGSGVAESDSSPVMVGHEDEDDSVAMATPPDSRGNTAEIPTRSPSRRHIHGHPNLSPLSGAQINVLSVKQSPMQPSGYQVAGQISGEGVKRAGIYVDDRLVKPIPVSPGEITSFDILFTMTGREATIRAYGAGSNFVEASIDLSNASGTEYSSNPLTNPYARPMYPINPYAMTPYGGVSPNGCPPNAPYYNPYGNPYCSPYPPPNPYGYANPYGSRPNSGPWWKKLF